MPQDPLAELEAKVSTKSADPLAELEAKHGVTSEPAVQTGEDWQKTLTPTVTHTGKPSVRRSDGGVWYGPEQGNTGKPGWFGAQGDRLPDRPTPGSVAGFSPEEQNQIMSRAQQKAPAAGTGLPGPLQNLARPMERTVEGATQFFDRSPEYTQALKGNEQAYQQERYSGPGSTALELAGSMAIPVPGVGKGGALARLGKAAATGAVVSGLQPVYGTPGEFAKEKAQQGVIGGLFGLGGHAAGEYIISPLAQRAAKVVAGLRAAKAGTAAPQMTDLVQQAQQQGFKSLDEVSQAAAQGNEAAKQLQQQIVQATAAKENVPLTLGDITQDAARKKQEVLLENLPGSMSEFRAGQAQAVNKAAQAKADEVFQKFGATKYQNQAAMEAAAANGDKNARYVLEAMKTAGDNPDATIQASLQGKLLSGRMKANQLYDEVEALAQANGRWKRPVPDTVKALEGITSTESQLAYDKDAVKFAQEYLTKIEDPKTVTDFGTMRQFRSQLGDEIAKLRQTGNDPTARALQTVRDAVEKDLENLATNSKNPELIKKFREANAAYRQEVVPYKDRVIKNIMEGPDPDKAVKAFYQNTSPDQQARLYEMLDDRGKAAVAYGAVQKALDSAVNPKSGNVSPLQFATGLRKSLQESGVGFKGEQKWALDGFVKLLQHVERAGQFAENPPTGQRAITAGTHMLGATGASGAILSTAMGHPGAAALELAPYLGIQAYGRGMSKLLTEPKGQKFLQQLSNYKPNTAEFDTFVQKYLPKALAAEAGAREVKPEPTEAEQP